MTINIYMGQVCKGKGVRPDHINIQIPHHRFVELLCGESLATREVFMGWINKEVYPALNDVPEKKITIELTR